MLIKRPTECINACCGAMCSFVYYQFNKVAFGDNPKKCPNYRFYEADVLDKIRAEIEQIANEEQKHDEKWAVGLRYAVKIIDKYRLESED